MIPPSAHGTCSVSGEREPMSTKIAKRQLREMSALAGAAAAGGTGDGGSREAKWGAQAAATGKLRIVCKDAQGKKLSKATAKRRRQKAFPLNFGA